MEEQITLSRREREIMDIVYSRSRASATDVLKDLAAPPSRASVRTLLRILEAKGHLIHAKRGREFIYSPTRPRRRAGQSAVRRVLKTFFNGSIEQALAAHLADPAAELSDEEMERLTQLIRKSRRKDKKS